MAKKPIQYVVVDAFTAEPFKGNPASVCVLDDAERAADARWMQAVATEFNLSQTAFLLRDSSSAAAAAPRFGLRWFTPNTEVALCGHATLASAHYLFTSVLAEHEALIEFATKSGILTAKKVPAPASAGVSGEGKLFIELDLPAIDFVECDEAELPSLPETLNGVPVVSVHKSTTVSDFIVELSSGKEVADIIPNIHEIKRCSGRGVIFTGPAPDESGYDFFTRFFCPKFNIDEDPVCGSAHCVLAPYWARKLGKQKLTAFQVSPRSGTLYLELEAAARRVRIQGEAVTVMTGTLLT
ncbi:hypothetical protein SETIT_5G049700v2 [Setaria italica]|nr:uncharacterized protein LOC101768427 [Setaria italica]XP_034596622.1 uncharacterized isomerase BH0283-like [Setaria viridis]RCV23991.1 hypothetical protein SETIT_5G049700v2 [Setaria italica]RCV23992.1 hypothetical protein SETIT_5G049700v2 [Setaria italica]TKW12636.1 hypothetical protein SEVIR_5G049100v2 [Setaria viridis]TKW12638.1 hypothetical protein SEVIR_5G049100v2 [Setaria viridis]